MDEELKEKTEEVESQIRTIQIEIDELEEAKSSFERQRDEVHQVCQDKVGRSPPCRGTCCACPLPFRAFPRSFVVAPHSFLASWTTSTPASEPSRPRPTLSRLSRCERNEGKHRRCSRCLQVIAQRTLASSEEALETLEESEARARLEEDIEALRHSLASIESRSVYRPLLHSPSRPTLASCSSSSSSSSSLLLPPPRGQDSARSDERNRSAQLQGLRLYLLCLCVLSRSQTSADRLLLVIRQVKEIDDKVEILLAKRVKLEGDLRQLDGQRVVVHARVKQSKKSVTPLEQERKLYEAELEWVREFEEHSFMRLQVMARVQLTSADVMSA
eukprot:748079-Hanusia_phi.AAC.3